MTHPSGLASAQIEEYLHRSYTRLDGLWFVLAEERHGFDAALALDEAVWKVLPKIQARLLQQQLNLSRDIQGLARALTAKLTLDRHEFTLSHTDDLVEVALTKCLWHELIMRSGREHIAERVGGVVCAVELPVFAREFNCACLTPSAERLCGGGAQCRFSFRPLEKPSTVV
jgi:hypothetical protein